MNSRLKRKFCAAAAAVLLSGDIFSVTALADWETESDKTYYTEENGNYAKGWKGIDGKTYYFTSGGVMAAKSRTIGGIRYKFRFDGICEGKYTGWTKGKNGRHYYKDGVMTTNKWINTKSGKKYYAGADGYMRTGWARVKGTGICFFDENGVWDGQKYYKGYQPQSMKYFLMDFDFSDDSNYEYCINYQKYHGFDGIGIVLEILEAEKDTAFVYDSKPSDDEIDMNPKIYHGGKQIIIRCAAETDASDWIPHIVFSKDKKGNSYFYCTQYGIGCKLSNGGAYDKIAELIS